MFCPGTPKFFTDLEKSSQFFEVAKPNNPSISFVNQLPVQAIESATVSSFIKLCTSVIIGP